MDHTKPAIETNENARPQDELRPLQDLELLLVGGGDDDPQWP